jgi:uncharacterized protein
MHASRAAVPTEASARYAKQLGSHLGRKIPVTEVPEGSILHFASGGRALLESQPDRLILHAVGPDDAALRQVEDVVARHLVRFGQRSELSVSWNDTDEAHPRLLEPGDLVGDDTRTDSSPVGGTAERI